MAIYVCGIHPNNIDRYILTFTNFLDINFYKLSFEGCMTVWRNQLAGQKEEGNVPIHLLSVGSRFPYAHELENPGRFARHEPIGSYRHFDNVRKGLQEGLREGSGANIIFLNFEAGLINYELKFFGEEIRRNPHVQLVTWQEHKNDIPKATVERYGLKFISGHHSAHISPSGFYSQQLRQVLDGHGQGAALVN